MTTKAKATAQQPEATTTSGTEATTTEDNQKSEPESSADQATTSRENEDAADAKDKDYQEQCSDSTADQELAENIDSINGQYVGDTPWDTQHIDYSTWDPCADLSWLAMSYYGGTGSTPWHVVLFHKGKFIGTATEKDHSFQPGVQRLDDDTIKMIWTYPREGEANATRTGRSEATFSWNGETHQVDMVGEESPF